MAAFSLVFMIRFEMAEIAISVCCVAPVEAVLGEGPLWDPRIGKLVFLDIKGERLFLYDPQSEETQTVLAPGKISALGLRAAGGYICARKDGFALLDLDGGILTMTPLAAPEADRPDNRFNDGKVDPFGGFWAGTMDEREKNDTAGAWWRLAPDGAVEKIDHGFHVTNGPAFDLARERAYFTDSARRTIFVSRATPTGFIDKRVFLKFGDGDGYPDGMEVDAEGNLWVAFWDGGAVRRFSPDGDMMESVAIPAQRPTSVAFAGARIFVTSARIGVSVEDLKRFPASGGLFEISVSRDLGYCERYYAG